MAGITLLLSLLGGGTLTQVIDCCGHTCRQMDLMAVKAKKSCMVCLYEVLWQYILLPLLSVLCDSMKVKAVYFQTVHHYSRKWKHTFMIIDQPLCNRAAWLPPWLWLTKIATLGCEANNCSWNDSGGHEGGSLSSVCSCLYVEKLSLGFKHVSRAAPCLSHIIYASCIHVVYTSNSSYKQGTQHGLAMRDHPR